MNSLKQMHRFGLVSVIAALMMGNEGCKEEERPPGRFLKKTVELQSIQAPNIKGPNGGDEFDFASVANWQIVDEISESEAFVIQMKNISKSAGEPEHVPNFQKSVTTRPDVAADPNPPECLEDRGQVIVGGKINSFEMITKTGACIGFSALGVGCGNLGPSGKVYIKSARLDLGLQAWSPFHENYIMGSGTAGASQLQADVGATIDFGLIRMGPEAFFQSPLANVTRSAIKQALEELINDMDVRAIKEKRPVWESDVALSTGESDYIKLNAGRMHLLQVGDQFQVYNVRTLWEGDVCNSEFSRETTSTKPAAIVQIMDEGDLDVSYAYAKIIEGNGSRIYPGALVRIHRLVGDAGEAQAR